MEISKFSIMNKRRLNLMKNKCYRQSRTKKQLIQMRNQGREFVVWKLNLVQKQDVEDLGFEVEPFIYSIETRTFFDIKKIHSTLLKDIHYAKKRKKLYLARPLKRREIDLLKEYGVKCHPLKYKIYLRK